MLVQMVKIVQRMDMYGSIVDNNIKLIEIRYDEDVWEVLTRELLDNQTTNEECK